MINYLMSFIYGSSELPDQNDQFKKWKTDLKKEQRSLTRECRKLELEEQKAKIKLKSQAQKGVTKDACIPLAKEILRIKKTRNRLIEAQTRINSVLLTLQTNMATAKVFGAMQKSTQLMTEMSTLMSVSQLKETAITMSKEMTKAGLISEMADDAFEALDDEDIDEEAETEIDKLIDEITQNQFQKVGMATKKIKENDKPVIDKEDDVANEEKEMKERFDKLMNS